MRNLCSKSTLMDNVELQRHGVHNQLHNMVSMVLPLCTISNVIPNWPLKSIMRSLRSWTMLNYNYMVYHTQSVECGSTTLQYIVGNHQSYSHPMNVALRHYIISNVHVCNTNDTNSYIQSCNISDHGQCWITTISMVSIADSIMHSLCS